MIQAILGALPFVRDLFGMWRGDRRSVETNVHDEQKAAYEALAAEAAAPRVGTWWDSFVDGLNRLPRPLMAFGVIGLFVYAIVSPAEFSVRMQAMGLVPEWLAIVLGQIILLYFGGRMLDKWPERMSGPSADQVRAVMTSMQEVRRASAEPPVPVIPTAPLPSDTRPVHAETTPLEVQLKDESRQMTGSAIAEWNRRRQTTS